MAYTAPSTKSSGDLLTAADWNTYIRDNTLADFVAQVTTAGDMAVASGSHALSRAPRGAITNGVWVPYVIAKTADETVGASTTLQNDDHLSFSVGANELWIVDLRLIVEGTAGDFKVGVTAPSGATVTGYYHGPNAAGAITTQNVTDLTASQINIEGTATPGSPRSPVFIVIANGANAGTLQIQWAQNTASGSTILKKGTLMLLTRVA